MELGCNPMMELGRKRTLPHGKHFKPEVRHKNNKALIKAEDLKGSSDTRRVIFRFSSAILKIGDGKIC